MTANNEIPVDDLSQELRYLALLIPGSVGGDYVANRLRALAERVDSVSAGGPWFYDVKDKNPVEVHQ